MVQKQKVQKQEFTTIRVKVKTAEKLGSKAKWNQTYDDVIVELLKVKK